MNWLNRFADPVYCLVRLIVGLMFACHGGQKILGFPPSERGLATNPIGLTAGWIELSCGFLIALGFLTRLAAFIASGEIDRKSTRLNSSHLVISYAVFCLKKKKSTHSYVTVRTS